MLRRLLFSISVYCCACPMTAQDVESIIFESWESNAWHNSAKYLYSYDDQGYLIQNLYLTFHPSSGTWVNSSRINYINHSNGTIYYYTSQYWDGSGNGWVNTQRATYSYSGSDRPSQVIYENWAAGNWTNSMQYLYTYDEDDFLTNLDIRMWSQSAWQHFGRYIYTGNGDGTIQSYIYQLYSNGAWSNNSRGSYTYNDSLDLLTTLIETWSQNSWQNSMFQENTYDENSYLVQNQSWLWNAGMQDWDPFTRVDYENNADGTVNQYISKNYDMNAGTWVNSIRGTYHYFPQTTVEDWAEQECQVFPNPTSGLVCFQEPLDSPTPITIFNASGVVVMNGRIDHPGQSVDLSGCAPGLYFILLAGSDQTRKARVVIR